MELSSVRELKRALTQTLLEDETTMRSFGVATQDAVPRSLALGVVASGNNDYRLAVRIQDRAVERSRAVELIEQQARGEVDVRYIGEVSAQSWHRGCHRPLQIGTSIGHFAVTAGTLGAFVRERRGGRLCILSNNHVLANGNNAAEGDVILQPGKTDDGIEPRDVIGRLGKFVELKRFEKNFVDAALATLNDDIKSDLVTLQDVGTLSGLGSEFLDEGTLVEKIGRTTGHTRGRITAFEMDNVAVRYGMGLARFNGQVEIQSAENGPFSRGGDSGSLIFDADRRGVALLFAGSEHGGPNGLGLTYANPLRRVLDELDVHLAL